jgi:3-oxoacyl-(acyl-carrier-protein) synthase/acyl carrier protein
MEIGARFGKEMFCWMRASDAPDGGYDLDVLDPEGRPAARVRGLRFAQGQSASRPLSGAESLSAANGHAIPASGPDEASWSLELERDLRASLAQALYLEQADVDSEALFTDLGMDSIIGVEWVDAINKKHGSRLSGTVLYQYPTIKKLAAHLNPERKPDRHVAPVALPDSASAFSAPSPYASAFTAPARPSADLKAELTETLTGQLAEALYLEARDIDRETLFTDLGMDSIIGVEWVTAINKKHGTQLSATALYQHPTLNRLAGMLAEEIAKRDGSPATLASLAPTALAAAAPETSMSSRPSQVAGPLDRPLESFRKTGPGAAPGIAVPAARKPRGIAVIGMAGQFPQAQNAEAFWRNIRDGKDCVTEVPEGRWSDSDFYQPGKPAQGKYYSRWMGAMDEVDCFDPLFFNISPTEAKSMDPQQRLFLQSCWHAIENAGHSAASLSESRCGVFVGASKGDYLHLSKEHELSSLGFTGGAISILAARASYFLNLLGPCVSIDTACSSALVAMASACDSLNAGTSDLALAGGVFIMSSPEMHIMTSQAGMLSTAGRCQAFDDRADGFVPSDGVGMVVLKRLDDAERDGDNILGVIEGWGVNQDGKTNGITAPNAASQTRLIQDVYDRFAIDAEGIQLIEAHGTGTKLGDPIEIDALKKAFGKYTRKTGYCAVGSVKSNIGHALTAAGMAGVIKVLHALQRKQLPPTIHVSEINRYIELADSPFYINTALREWKVPAGGSRRAAVSSFGFSGTNSHLVIAEYALVPVSHVPEHSRPAGGKLAVPLSAKTREQLAQKAGDLLRLLESDESIPALERIAYTLQVGRDAMPFRLALAAGDREELAEGLRAFLGDRKLPDALWEGKADGEEARSTGTVPPSAIEQARAGQPQALLRYWIRGGEVDWGLLYPGRKPQRAPLPGYPFAKLRCWIEKQYASASAFAPESRLHPLLQRNTSTLERQSYALTLRGDEPFLQDHRLRLPGGQARKLLPGAAYLEMARAAYALAMPDGRGGDGVALGNVVWMNPLFVDGKTEVAIALYGYADVDDAAAAVAFEITSRGAKGEILHCKGEAGLIDPEVPAAIPLAALRARMRRGEAGKSEIYETFVGNGLIYGPSHRRIAALALGDDEALARMEPASEAEGKEYGMPPGLLDGALQSSIGMLWRDKDRLTAPRVPFSIGRLTAFSSCENASHAWVRRAKRRSSAGGDLELDIDLLDDRGGVCVRVEGFTFRAIGSDRTIGSDRMIAAERNQAQAEPEDADAVDYEALLDQVINKRITIEKAAELL